MSIALDTLHGPPEIGGVTMPEADFDSPVDGRLDLSESVTKTLADGTIKLVIDRRRRRWSLGWKDLTETQHQNLVDVLDARTGITFLPRTKNEAKGDDPMASEPSYTVRLVSDSLVVSRRLNVDRFDVVIELEEVAWHS